MAWLAYWPTESVEVSGSTTQIRANWAAMQAWWEVEHVSIASASSGAGQHLAGTVGFVIWGDFSALPSTAATGALAYTDIGFFIYTPNDAWDSITETYWSRIRQSNLDYLNTSYNDLVIPASTWTKMAMSATSSHLIYDSMSEYSTAANRWTAKEEGFYMVIGNIVFPDAETNYQKAAAISQNGAAVAVGRKYGSPVKSVLVKDVLYIDTGDYLELYGWHNHTAAVTADAATLMIQRVS